MLTKEALLKIYNLAREKADKELVLAFPIEKRDSDSAKEYWMKVYTNELFALIGR